MNGVKAHGGAINGPGAVVVGGMVLINSGYGRNSGLAGNVLLAFAPEDRRRGAVRLKSRLPDW